MFILAATFCLGADEGTQTDDPSKKDEISALIEKLGEESYEEREEAFEAIQAYGDKARPLLKEALENEDPEIRWRALRLLSDLDGKGVKRLETARKKEKAPRRPFEGRGLKGMKDKGLWPSPPSFFPGRGFRGFDLDSLNLSLRGLDDLFQGLSLPRFHLFDESDFHEGGFEDLMRQLMEEEEDLSRGIQRHTTKYRMEHQDEQGGEKLSLDIDTDGSVTVTVTEEDEDGETKKEVYEAESMEAFREAYPEIASRFHLEGFRFDFNAPGSRLHLPPLKRDGFKRFPFWTPDEKGRQKTLGIYIDPEGPGRTLRFHLGLEKGEGVLVNEVVEDAFAEEVGVKPMDVIVSLNGEGVGSAEEIRALMSEMEQGRELTLGLYRKGKKIELSGEYTFFEPEIK
jgi:hypothetical protein